MRVIKIVKFSFVFVVVIFLLGNSMLFAEADPYSKLQAIRMDKSISGEEKGDKLKKFANSLSLKDAVSIAETIAQKHENRCDDQCISEMVAIGSYICEAHKFDYEMAVSEIKNKERPSAWRWMWLNCDASMWNSTESPVYGNLDKFKEYTSVLCTIVSDKEDNPRVRIKATQNLFGQCYWKLRATLEKSPITNEKLKNKIKLEDIIDEGVPEDIAPKVNAIVQITEKTIDVSLQMLKDPNQDEEFLIRLIGQLRGYYSRGIIEQDEIEKAIREAFSKRRLYSEKVQVELAQVMFFQLSDDSILPELRIMYGEMENEINKFQVKELFRDIKVDRYKRGLETLEEGNKKDFGLE